MQLFEKFLSFVFVLILLFILLNKHNAAQFNSIVSATTQGTSLVIGSLQ